MMPLPEDCSLPGGTPAWRHRLSTRILALTLGGLAIVLAMITGTLWLSWQLEGAGAAINDAGSLRMRANRVQIELIRASGTGRTETERLIAEQGRTLARLAAGDPSRPLFLPAEAGIQRQFALVERYWQGRMVPSARASLDTGHWQPYLANLTGFIDETNRLVTLIEQANERKSTLLRLSQGVLALVACMGSLAVAYLLYLWIILPLLRLQDGVRRMARHDFSVRLPVDSRDEFGELMQGFNTMADELEGLYRGLEARVTDKTQRLARQNHELSTLYGVLAFLNQPAEIEPLCRGFLSRVMQSFGAEGGSLRVLDAGGERLHLVVAEGLSPALASAAHCARVDACHCGQATRDGVVLVRTLGANPQGGEALPCAQAGFASLAAFRIGGVERTQGEFTLHFTGANPLTPAQTQLLTLLGQHLGVALENRRLSARARELAVSHERSLLAQGLHDSIAQGLNFIRMQVDLLKDARAADNQAEADEIVELIAGGADESYQDVRELLTNFRSKLGAGELVGGIREAAARFTRQSGVAVDLQLEDAGAPLSPEHQLQLLFIVQEALSNVRKHAGAGRVQLTLAGRGDLLLEIADDGDGFDAGEVSARGEGHIGLHIMRERAERIGARLEFDTRPGGGTRVRIQLPHAARQAA